MSEVSQKSSVKIVTYVKRKRSTGKANFKKHRGISTEIQSKELNEELRTDLPDQQIT